MSIKHIIIYSFFYIILVEPSRIMGIENVNLEFFSRLSLPLFAFYMMMFGNFTNRLLGDKMYYFIQDNAVIKHLIAFVNLLFFIILANEGKLDEDIVELFFYAALVYLLVIMTLLLHPVVIAFIILLLLIIYILNIIVKIRVRVKKDYDVKALVISKNVLAFVTVSIIFIGYGLHFYHSLQNKG